MNLDMLVEIVFCMGGLVFVSFSETETTFILISNDFSILLTFLLETPTGQYVPLIDALVQD